MWIMDNRSDVVDAALEEHLLAHRDTLAKLFSQAQRAIAREDVASLTAIAARASWQRARLAADRHGDL
jgi:hypothetical protein